MAIEPDNAALENAVAVGDRLADAYRLIEAGPMADVPILNLALAVAPVGFRSFGTMVFGMMLTPWFLNLVAIPDEDTDMSGVPSGTTIKIGLPAGEVDFLSADVAGFGPLLSCSLFSPVFEFRSQDEALAVAEAAIEAFFDLHALEDRPPEKTAPVNRRALLRGRFSPEEVTAP